MELKDYNDKLSERWNKQATELNSELFFALSVEAVQGRAEVFMFWDNVRGNQVIIDHLKAVVKMLEDNKDKNFSSKNFKPNE